MPSTSIPPTSPSTCNLLECQHDSSGISSLRARTGVAASRGACENANGVCLKESVVASLGALDASMSLIVASGCEACTYIYKYIYIYTHACIP